MRDNPRIMTRARTFLGLAVGVLLPLVASGQGAHARPDPKSPTAERLPIYDPDHLGGPANFYVDPKTNELFIADGYINKRVVVYDAATGKYKRHWGAYGKRPDDTEKYTYPVTPENPPQQYSTLHGLVGTKDGLIYVSDRRGNRIQVFRQNGEYLMERFVRPETGGKREAAGSGTLTN